VAHILRPRGNKGEVAAELLTDFPQRLTELREAFVDDSRGQGVPRRIAITACWLSQNHPGQAVFPLRGLFSINHAEKFRGLDVCLLWKRISLSMEAIHPSREIFPRG